MKPKNLFCCTLFVHFFCFALAQPASLIKDIETLGESPTLARSIGEINGKIILSLNDGYHGEELFVMNSPTDRPVLLKEINPGVASSTPQRFTLANGLLFFVAQADLERNLWVTDGTESGTRKISVPSSTNEFPRAMTPAGDKLFFKGTIGHNLEGLFVTDGTEEGTSLLKTQYFDGSYQFPDKMLVYNRSVYFKDGSSTWVSDGTPEGTHALSTPLKLPHPATTYYEYNNILYFSSYETGIETWHWDGTTAGTHKLGNRNFGSITSGILLNGKFYFTSNDSEGEGMWSIDEEDNISLVCRAYSLRILSANNYILLKINSSNQETPSLWRFDPASEQTTYVSLLSCNGLNYIPLSSSSFANGKSLIVGRNLGTGGDKTWITDGTAAGTLLYSEFASEKTFFAEAPALFLGNYFLWKTMPGDYGLYYFDGTRDGSYPVQLPQLNSSSSPGSFIRFQDQVLFSAYENLSFGIWSTQGGSQNTFLLRKATSGLGGFSYAIEWNNELYFTWADTFSDSELWKTDGTINGTVLVKDIMPGSTGSFPRQPFIFNNRLYFFATINNKQELWSTDGTSDGTQYAMDANEPYSGVSVYNGNFYFIATHVPPFLPALFKSNGTPEGTTMLQTFHGAGVSTDNAGIRQFYALQDGIYFTADDGTSGLELWKMNLADESVSIVKDINPGHGSSEPRLGFVKDNQLYFTANDGTHGNELWISGGTEENTVLLKETIPGEGGIQLYASIEYNDKMYLGITHDDGVAVWMTNGTTANTELFYQQSGFDEGEPLNFLVTHGKLFFSQNGIVKQSLGTPETISIVDLGVEFDKQYTPFNFFEFNDLTLFQGYTPDIGSELWALDFRTQEQTVDFSVTDKIYGDPDFEITGTSTSDLSLYFVSSDKKKLVLTDQTAHITGAGNVTIKGIQSGNSVLKSANKEVSIVIHKASQTIFFELSSPIHYSPNGQIYLTATASSGLPVQFESSAPLLVAVTENLATIKGVGTLSVTAYQDDQNYERASLTKELTILKGRQEIILTKLANQLINNPAVALAETTTAGLPIIYTTNNSEIQLKDNVINFSAAGSVTLLAAQPGNELYEAAQSVQQTFCINPLPPHITAHDMILNSDGIGNHQWFKNDMLLVNEKTSTYTVTESGIYKTRVEVRGCASSFSESLSLLVTDVENDKNTFAIYPNPTDGPLFVDWPKASNTKNTVTIYNDLGIEVATIEITDGSEISVSGCPPGIYLLVIHDQANYYFQKIVKR